MFKGPAAFILAIALALGMGGCGDSDSVTESGKVAVQGSDPNAAEVCMDPSKHDTAIPIIGGWRALQLKKGSDTETDSSFEYVLLFGEDGQYRVTYEEARKYEYKNDCLYLYQDKVIDYLKYSVLLTENGFVIKPVSFSYQNTEYDIEEYKNKYKLDPASAPVHLSDKPSYKLFPYDGRYKNAEEEYKQSMEIKDLKVLNSTAKSVFVAVNDYFYEHGTNRKSYDKYAGDYSKTDKGNELSEVIASALSETESMDVECCFVAVLNKDNNEYSYFIQTKSKGHNQIGQYPEPRKASFDNPSLSADIVYGTYTPLPE